MIATPRNQIGWQRSNGRNVGTPDGVTEHGGNDCVYVAISEATGIPYWTLAERLLPLQRAVNRHQRARGHRGPHYRVHPSKGTGVYDTVSRTASQMVLWDEGWREVPEQGQMSANEDSRNLTWWGYRAGTYILILGFPDHPDTHMLTVRDGVAVDSAGITYPEATVLQAWTTRRDDRFPVLPTDTLLERVRARARAYGTATAANGGNRVDRPERFEWRRKHYGEIAEAIGTRERQAGTRLRQWLHDGDRELPDRVWGQAFAVGRPGRTAELQLEHIRQRCDNGEGYRPRLIGRIAIDRPTGEPYRTLRERVPLRRLGDWLDRGRTWEYDRTRPTVMGD